MAGSSLPRHRVYDVFLSFRGIDTRRGIVSHLHRALVGMGIITFIDDRGLEIGDHVSGELRRSIECSRFAIVVLSESYATSRWCLMELQLIMELRREKRLEVFPIFYGIDPSSVRNQRGSFSLEMYNDQEMVADKVPKWLEALNQIANLSGKVSMDCIDEGTMVGDVARYISRRVTLMRKIDTENFVGVKAHVDGISTLLDLNSNEVCLIQGIWGMGGIGKTTIAKCLFDKLSPEFPACCFLENIRRNCNDDNHDLVHLQKELLRSIFPTCDDFELWSVEAGCEEIKSRLKFKNVLIVLDGVDKVTQVQALAENISWFGPGSRIIITTQDRGLLTRCGVRAVYEVTCLDDKDSLRMFQQIAFKGESPPDGLEQLIERASRLAHGLPSALRAYALFFSGIISDSLKEWEESVRILEGNLDEDIMNILKVSYDGLSTSTKKAFLHVACLFNSEPLDRVLSLLDGSRPETSLWIRILKEKSVIKISSNGCIIMHKLVEKMGRKIMHDCRKFLGDAEEIRDALISGDGTKETECMSLHTCDMSDDLSLTTNVVYHMGNLKFLKIFKHLEDAKSMLHLIPDSNSLAHHNIRLFHWDAYPFDVFPSCDHPSRLVELNLRHSNIVKLWSGEQVFMNLKRLDVTGSKDLRELPDLSKIYTLEELIMEHCTSLEGIPKIIGGRSNLKKLKLSYFDKRKRPLIVRIHELPEELRIELSFPDSSVTLTQLMNLSIDGDILVHIGSSLQGYSDYLSFTSEQHKPLTSMISAQQARLPSLEFLFNRFDSLIITRSSHRDLSTPLTTFTSSTELFYHLKELKLINLNIQEISYTLHQLKLLERLDLSGNGFETLPEDMAHLVRLKTLWLRNCYNLKELPLLTQVQTLTLSNCTNLISLVDLSHSNHVESYCMIELCLENCNNVAPLSDQLKYFKRLTYLNLRSHEFVRLPSSIRDLTSLVTLCVNNCKNLLSLEELPVSLQFLDAHDCDSLKVDSAQHFKSKQNKEAIPRNACFKETEIPRYVSKHQTTRSHRNIYLPEITDACKFLSIPIFIILIAIVIILLRQ